MDFKKEPAWRWKMKTVVVTTALLLVVPAMAWAQNAQWNESGDRGRMPEVLAGPIGLRISI